jgi:hypothetical protein
MTGKQKIQAVAKIITQESKNLISGNAIEVSSDTLEEAGVSLDEQTHVLDALASSTKPLQYTAMPVYKSVADIDPATRYWVKQTALLHSESEQSLLDRLLKSCIYSIELLDSSKPDATNDTKAAKTVGDNPIYQVSLRLKGKLLRLYIDDTPSEVVKRFKSKSANNIRAYFELQNSRGSYLTKEEMHIVGKSVVKDLPKTMGIEGLLADYFIEIDSKGQRLKIPKAVPMSQADLEILLAYVKRKSQTK